MLLKGVAVIAVLPVALAAVAADKVDALPGFVGELPSVRECNPILPKHAQYRRARHTVMHTPHHGAQVTSPCTGHPGLHEKCMRARPHTHIHAPNAQRQAQHNDTLSTLMSPHTHK